MLNVDVDVDARCWILDAVWCKQHAGCSTEEPLPVAKLAGAKSVKCLLNCQNLCCCCRGNYPKTTKSLRETARMGHHGS